MSFVATLLRSLAAPGRWALAALCWASQITYAEADSKPPLDVAACIESTRVLASLDGQGISMSPDRTRYALATVTGDIAANGLWVEIMAGKLDSLSAAEPKVVARLFTSGLGSEHGFGDAGGAPSLTSALNTLSWLDERRVALRWQDDAGTLQVLAIDVESGEREYLTREQWDVAGFAAIPNGRLLYQTRRRISRERSEQMLAEGFAVQSPDALTLIAGIVDGTSSYEGTLCDIFAAEAPAGSRPVRIALERPIFCELSYVSPVAGMAITDLISPDGTRIVLNASATEIPGEWRMLGNQDLQNLLKQFDADPAAFYSRFVQRLVVADLRTGEQRPLGAMPVNRQAPLRLAWSPDSRHVLIWPGFVISADKDAVGMQGYAVVEIDVETGAQRELPLAAGDARGVTEIAFTSASRASVVLNDLVRVWYERRTGQWRRIKTEPSASHAAHRHVAPDPAIRVEIRQSHSSPPALYAVSHDGRSHLLRDLNPRLRNYSLGRTERFEWRDSDGRLWEGLLFYPVRHERNRRYPLVIQLGTAASSDQFTLYGPSPTLGFPGAGPGWSVFLAQVLAGEGIMVLQANGLGAAARGVSELDAMKMRNASVQAAVKTLASRGLVDVERVGLMGHSVTGRAVQHAIAHPRIKIAAAIISDAADPNYLTAALQGWPNYSDDMNAGAPFGDGLKAWLENAPAFNVEKIATPVQIIVSSASEGYASLLTSGWELFSRLRYLKKPVEYFVVPDIRHGSHILQNPRQLLVTQTRALDWWRFWLKGEERAGERLEAQYASWRALRSQANGR